MFKHIFVPLDESPCAQAGFRVAVGLAACNQAAVTVCHVIDISNAVPVFPESGIATQPWFEAAQAAGAALIGSARTYALAHGIAFESMVRNGPTATTLLEAADDSGAEMIVMGSHGRTGVSHLFLGSVAEAVLHRAGIPVLIVRDSQAAKDAGSFRHILVAHDGSSHSERAFAAALDLATLTDASLTVCYVVDLANLANIVGTTYFAADTTVTALQQQGKRVLEGVRKVKPDVATELLCGIPADEILEYARKLNADAIVMGSHGRSGISRAILGSVAEAVMRRALTPVMIVADRKHSEPTRKREPALGLRAPG
jgi:nucleotide-binding universal stress UspA family protein